MRRYAVDWGHLAFVLAIAAFTCWYLADAATVSLAATNLLFIGPVGGVALLLCLLVARQCVRPKGIAAHQGRTDVIDVARGAPVAGTGDTAKIAGVAAALVLLVALLGVLGFDGAILIFSAVTMWICGERRVLPLLLYPIAVTLVIVLGFRAILPFPMLTVLL